MINPTSRFEDAGQLAPNSKFQRVGSSKTCSKKLLALWPSQIACTRASTFLKTYSAPLEEPAPRRTLSECRASTTIGSRYKKNFHFQRAFIECYLGISHCHVLFLCASLRQRLAISDYLRLCLRLDPMLVLDTGSITCSGILPVPIPPSLPRICSVGDIISTSRGVEAFRFWQRKLEVLLPKYYAVPSQQFVGRNRWFCSFPFPVSCPVSK